MDGVEAAVLTAHQVKDANAIMARATAMAPRPEIHLPMVPAVVLRDMYVSAADMATAAPPMDGVAQPPHTAALDVTLLLGFAPSPENHLVFRQPFHHLFGHPLDRPLDRPFKRPLDRPLGLQLGLPLFFPLSLPLDRPLDPRLDHLLNHPLDRQLDCPLTLRRRRRRLSSLSL
ncbi:hypothetical protein ACN47E_005377 [Coniothyrium glycines]